MNREHAEHILDAYAHMRMCESYKDASDALREVILDAMTEYRAKPNHPNISYPLVRFTDTTKSQTNLAGTQKVTFTGIDPAFGIDTTAVTCKVMGSSTNNLMYPDYMTKWYDLSCGHSVMLKGDEPPECCPVCGKLVTR